MRISLQLLIALLILGCANIKQNPSQQQPEIAFDISASNLADLIEVEVGELNLPSGQIIVGDPFFTYDIKPFLRKVTPGKYPVKLFISRMEDDHYRIAFAKLKVKPELATKWHLAITEDIKSAELESMKEDDFFGFFVEAGLACFVDKLTNDNYTQKIDSFYKANPDGNYYDDILAAEFG